MHKTIFTSEFLGKQREIIHDATNGKWMVGYVPEYEADQDYAGHFVGGATGEDVYDHDMGVFCLAAYDQDNETQNIPETICSPYAESDAVHIAEAHNNYPAALDEIEYLQRVVDDLREALQRFSKIDLTCPIGDTLAWDILNARAVLNRQRD